MFRKLNIKVLILILVIIAAIYAITEFAGPKDRSFSRVIYEIDTARVTQVLIHFPSDNVELKLVRQSVSDWQIVHNNKTHSADPSTVRSILGQFVSMKPESIAATSKEKWKDFEVDDSLSIHVTLLSGKKKLADVYFGKFAYSQPADNQAQMMRQQQGKMTTYVRKAKDERVYAVEGFMRMSYQKDPSAYRNKTLVNLNRDDISRLEFVYPDYRFVVEKINNKWMLNNQPADSLKTLRYLTRITRLSSNNFIEPETPRSSEPTHKLTIEGNNFSPITLSAYSTPDTTIRWIITSSVNPQGEFDGSKVQLFERTFVSETEFLPDNQ